MQPFMMQRLQHPTALTRPSSLDISRLSPTAGSWSGSRDPQNEEDVVENGILPLWRHIQTLPLLTDSSNTQEGKWCRKQFSDAEMNLPLTFAPNPPKISPATFSMETVLPTNLHGWVAGVLVASSLFVAAPVEALDEVLSLCMLDSEVTTGPITEFLLSRQEQRARDDFSDRVSEAVEWLEKGRLAQARGDFSAALNCFNQVTEKAGDLALAEYARVGHAVTLYEVGDRGQAIIEMEDVSISLKGYPEIHAALAAALYADKHAPIPAEKQFTIATLLDPRYTDLVWVQETKHWPPSLLKSLQRFISLS